MSCIALSTPPASWLQAYTGNVHGTPGLISILLHHGELQLYLWATHSLHTDLGHGGPLVNTPRNEYVLPNIRHAWSLRVPVHHPPHIHVTQNLMMLLRSSLNLTDSVIAMLWVTWFGFLHMTDVYLPTAQLRPSRACFSLNAVATRYQLHPSAVLLSLNAHEINPFQTEVH